MGLTHADLSPADARARFRDGLVTPTAGWSRGWTQANLVALPRDLAYDFLLFAQRNPKPCPVLDVLDAGEVSGPLLDGDVRTDLPAYRVYVDGELVEETPDVRGWWREDLVSFLVGCSFTFEDALLDGGRAGAPRRAGRQRADVPHQHAAAARPGRCPGRWWSRCARCRPAQVADAVRITSRYPAVHGAPGARRRPGGARDRRPRRAPTSATRSRSVPARSRCSGPAG